MLVLWIVLGTVLCIPLLAVVLSHVIWHRSFMASFVEFYIKHQDGVGYAGGEETARRKIEANDGLRYDFPKGYTVKAPLRESTESGIRTYWVNEHEGSEYLIFYLAGGAFLHGPKTFHWRFIDEVCRSTGATAAVPIYDRLPDRTCTDIFPAMTDLYRSLAGAKDWKKVILMGDSAGGNIVFVIAEELLKGGFKQPDEIISISPPAGYPYAGHEDEFAQYERTCVFLSIGGVNLLADRWAGDAGLDDYRVSPYFGEVRGMGRVTIIAGDRELLYPSGRAMHRKLLENGVESEFVSGRGMMHDYPVLPMPEAKKARRQISDIVTRP